MRHEMKTGDWIKGADGRYFRQVGNSIEYAPDMVFRGESSPVVKQIIPKEDRMCPLKTGMNTKCEEDCALYDKGCAISLKKEITIRDTKGCYCPMGNRKRCSDDCGFYNNGCGINKIINGIYAERSRDE